MAKGQLQSTARSIVGTSLIGARGATPRDQDKIDDTAAVFAGRRHGARKSAPLMMRLSGKLPGQAQAD